MNLRTSLIAVLERMLIRLVKHDASYRWKDNDISFIHPLDIDDRMPEEEIQEIQPGDVLWCLMPMSLSRLLEIEKSHRVRPYLVTEVGDEGVWGYYCSSSPLKRIAANEQYILHKERYFAKKDTYVNLHKKYFIPYSNVKNYYFSIDYRTLLLLREHQKHVQEPLINTDFNEGTIVEYNEKLYLIYQADHAYVYGTLLLPYKALQGVSGQDMLLVLFDTIYTTNFNKLKNFSRNRKDITFYSCCSKETVEEIKQLRKRIKQSVKEAKRKEVKRNDGGDLQFLYNAGTMLSAPNFHYYVYLFTLGKYSYGVDMGEVQGESIILQTIPACACEELGLCVREMYERILQCVVHCKYSDYIRYLRKEYEKMERNKENIFV